jgi:hypothetical protein
MFALVIEPEAICRDVAQYFQLEGKARERL